MFRFPRPNSASTGETLKSATWSLPLSLLLPLPPLHDGGRRGRLPRRIFGINPGADLLHRLLHQAPPLLLPLLLLFLLLLQLHLLLPLNELLVSPPRALASLPSPAGTGCAAGSSDACSHHNDATRLGSHKKRCLHDTGQRVLVQNAMVVWWCGGGGSVVWWLWCGRCAQRVCLSIRASYVQLI